MSWKAPIELPTGVEPLPAPDWLGPRLAELGVELDQGDADRLGLYLALLIAANKVVNLTAITDPEEGWSRHIADSLSLLPILAEAEAEPDERQDERLRVIDVGTGGGLPGLVLAACAPDMSFTLLDATAKKCAFLEHATSEMGLENIDVVCARAEDAGQRRGERSDAAGTTSRTGAMRASFDVVLARAVGRLAVLAELTVPFARVGGLCALIKGGRADEELEEAAGALHLLHASHAGTIETPTGKVVVLEKRRETPRAYPRASGEPKRSPLGVEKRR